MISEPLYQTQLIQRDLLKSSKNYNVHSDVSKTFYQTVRDKMERYLVLFLETSSIHGLNHLVAMRRHPFEILLWLTTVGLSVFGAVYLSRMTWLRYQSSPTVVSMDRDMFAWNTTFPCVTICPNKKLDKKKLAAYIQSSPEPDKVKLEAFIRALANATYENFDTIPEYDVIDPNDYMGLLLNLSGTFKPILTIGASGISLHIIPTITEMGLCYGVNSKVAIYNSPSYRAANRWDIVHSNNNTFFVHPLDGEVFAQVINLSTSYDAYIHGPLEVPDVSTKHQHSEEDYYMKLYVTALTVYTAPEAAKLSVAQRRCRFLHENNLRHNAVYTYTMCRMECRIRLCLKYCKCIPHFYRKIGDEKVCDVKGLHCLAKYTDELYQLQIKEGTKTKRLNCGCYPICDDVNYVIQSNVLQEWFLGTNLQWGIVTYPRLRYRRDIIFGFTDVLVAVGGMAGLFLGCSVLSFMEIVYFLTLRLLCYAHANRRK
ncbi:sodium channel protein Nach-like [Plodia interpunctella]|uniref:sodium channel protein Nach-like n=1 Tax=Plodia interpunctella TaxID=58824 RepID=UPI002367D84A|nr:sodium channel protein Nach-like [Plodia interpunctella]